MKHRVVVYSAVVLGVVALMSSFAQPMVSAQGSTGESATITVTCRSTGDLFVDYTYSGFSGAVRGVDFHVDRVGDIVDATKGGSGEVIQAFNQTTLGYPVDWGTVSAQLVAHSDRVIAGSSVVWDNGNPVTC